MSNMLYNIRDKMPWGKFIVSAIQQLLSVICATILIAQICGTPISSCLLGACVGTLIYQVITGFKSPMFISSCGATVSAVCGALALNATIAFPGAASYATVDNVTYAYDALGNVLGTASPNYLMVFIGGLIILAIYGIFALVIKFTGTKFLNKVFPPTIVGAVTIVIGANLARFLVSYLGQGGAGSAQAIYLGLLDRGLDNVEMICAVVVALITMFTTAIISHYGYGFMKNIPFLFGLAAGLLAAGIFTLCGVRLLTFDAFNHMEWYPDLVFLKWQASNWSWVNLGKTVLYFVPVAICALLEHYSDHKVLSNIIGTDLTQEPGLHRTLLGDGVASALGTAVGGLPNTSYGESIATTGFSKVASVWVITAAAGLLGLMSFLGPVSALVKSIPPAVFGGCAMILYGFIAASGLKTIVNNQVNLDKNKNLIIVSVILTVGISGIFFLDAAFSGVALAMVLGVILNLVLRDKKEA